VANKNLFQSVVGRWMKPANAVNEAGGSAYTFDPRHALAQYAVTGCMNSTFYAQAEQILDQVLRLCRQVEPEFIAKTALFARTCGFMKDSPALLCAVLSVRSPGLMAEIFDRVLDNGKMLRNFVQIIRSGVVGRKSLGTLPKRMIQQWLQSRTPDELFVGSTGQDPSLADIIKMVHPKPSTPQHEALYGYLIGREYAFDALPDRVRQFESFKRQSGSERQPLPDVPFQFLTALNLTRDDWVQIARNASWQVVRMNLNTFQRHGVFTDKSMVREIADKLRDPERIQKARVFPYQLMAAYLNADSDLPRAILDALQDALEISVQNIPDYPGKIYVFPDVSGSMHTPVTGFRKGSSSKIRCVDVAALISSAILRKNPDAQVMPFSTDVVDIRLNSRDSVMTNAQKLASLPQGGTNCSAPLARLNRNRAIGDLVIYVSDNESWIDSSRTGIFRSSPTATLKQWQLFKSRNPQAKLICVDLQPNRTTQAAEHDDIVNVGGFSDQVFRLIAEVAAGKTQTDYWVREIGRQAI
jgi:60 kDa SS-A/Ro ribonucleoprotein